MRPLNNRKGLTLCCNLATSTNRWSTTLGQKPKTSEQLLCVAYVLQVVTPTGKKCPKESNSVMRRSSKSSKTTHRKPRTNQLQFKCVPPQKRRRTTLVKNWRCDIRSARVHKLCSCTYSQLLVAFHHHSKLAVHKASKLYACQQEPRHQDRARAPTVVVNLFFLCGPYGARIQ